MEPIFAPYKVAGQDYPIKSQRDVPEGIVYTTEIDGRDFCILESHAEKDAKELTKE
jgi:hypothetical protein